MADEVRETQETEDPQSGAAEFERELSDSFVDPDTGGDLEDQDQPEPVDDGGQEDVEQPEAEPVRTTEDSTIQEPKRYKVPDDSLYGDLRGKKATAIELEAAGLLDKLLGRDHQELHHVKLYQELRKEFDDYRKSLDEQRQQPPPQPQGRELTPEEYAAGIENQYVPELQRLASAGAFEPDFLRAYPRVSSHIEHRFRSGGYALGATIQHVTKLTEALNDIREWVGMKQSDDGRSVAQMTLSQKLDEAASAMPALAEQAVRERFTQWASDPDNALTDRMATQDIKDLTKEQILGAFAAYVAMTGDGVPKQTQQRRRPRDGSNMAGGGGASRGSSTPGSNQPRNAAEGFEQELTQSGWRG